MEKRKWPRWLRAVASVLLIAALASKGSAQSPNQCSQGSCPCPDASSPCRSGSTYGLSVGNTAIQLWGSDGNRKELVIQNQPGNSGSVCVAIGQTSAGANITASATPPLNCFVLPASTLGSPLVLSNRGQSNNWGQVATGPVSVISLTGTNAITYYFSD